MSSYTNKGYPYGRQMSDTQFYNKRRKVDMNDDRDGQRTVSYSESIRENRNDSSRNRYDVNCPSPGYNHSRRFQHDSNSTGMDHRCSNGIICPGYNVFNKRSENVVRFHKDVVTDVQETFTNKMQVDKIESNYSGKSIEHIGDANEMVELQSPSHDQRERAISFDKTRQSSEQNRAMTKPVGHRKESKRTKETKFFDGKDTPVTSNGYCLSAGFDNKGNGSHYANNKHIVQNEPFPNVRNIEGDQKRHHSSKRREHLSRNMPNLSRTDNRGKTKTALHKTRSSSSTESSQNGKIKHDNGFISKDMELCLTKTDSNSSSTRKSTKSHSDQVELKLQFENKGELARKKKRKTCCVVLSLLTTIIVVVAMVLGAILFIQSKDTQKDSLDRQRVYDMVNVHTRFRVINRKYNAMFRNNSSPQFNTFSVQLCNEVDVIYMTSPVSQHYYGCKVRSLRAGSVRVYYVSPFLDTTDTSNTTLHREILLNNPTTVFSTIHAVNTTFLGDFLVDVNSIEIAIERFQITNLPQKPLMPIISVSSTPEMTPSFQHEHGDSTPLSRQFTTPLDKATTAPGKLVSTNVPKSTTPQNRESASKTDGNAPTISTLATLVNTDDWPIDTTTDSNIYNDKSTIYSNITDPGRSTSIYSGIDNDTQIASKPVVNETSLNKTFITAIGDSVFLMKQSARVECLVNHSNDLASLIVQHRDFWGNYSMLTDVSIVKLDSQMDLSDTLSATKTLSVTFSKDSIMMRVDFTEVNCNDVGVYTCIVKTITGEELRADSVLNGTAEPGMPQLSVPIALIENKEIKQPMMCTADVGFPNGELQWKIKPKGSDEFLEFPGHITSQSGRCKNFVTNSLIYTPTKDGNGTLLKCEVVNKQVPHPPDLTAVTDLYILPENMCDGVLINRTIRHPFTCMKYIRCLGRSFEVKECVNKMCYDEESAQCGQTKLRMTDVVAYLNEGVTSVQCRLDHLGVWSNITISKLNAISGKEPIASVFSASSAGNEIKIYETSMKDRVFVHKESSQDFEIKINLWLYVLTCADEGEYICEAFTPTDHKMATGRIELRGKPEAPKIIVPNEVIEGMPTRDVTCQANVGYPEGRLAFKMKLQNETEFYPIRFNVTTEETIQNCSKVLRKSFTFTPALRHEKAELLCEVENKFTLPINKKLVAKEVVHIVPKNFCLTHGPGTPHVHPYDCRQYVQCYQGYIYVQRCGSDHCFNPHTIHCDIEVNDKDVPFDPKHPCLPDKNGVFFHHPILCNKYIWCVQGQEVVHHCPLGTLYIDGGQCTFEPERSRCYNTNTVE